MDIIKDKAKTDLVIYMEKMRVYNSNYIKSLKK